MSALKPKSKFRQTHSKSPLQQEKNICERWLRNLGQDLCKRAPNLPCDKRRIIANIRYKTQIQISANALDSMKYTITHLFIHVPNITVLQIYVLNEKKYILNPSTISCLEPFISATPKPSSMQN